MPRKIDAAVKERALWMFANHRRHYRAGSALAEAAARRVGEGRETARRRLAHGGGMATVAVFSLDDLDTGSAHAPWATAGRHRS